MRVTLGIDIGTSATKAVLCDKNGSILASRAETYGCDSPRPGWSEQDPETWWTASCGAIRALVAEASKTGASIASVGFSGQMHGSVLLDEKRLGSGGEAAGALRPAILWNDQRTGEQCEEIERLVGGRRRLVERVGNAALTGFTLPKLLWVRHHEPDVFARVAVLMLPKDYVRFRLTGEAATDVGDAAGTLLLDVDERRWSDEVAQATGIDPSILPRILESGQIAGRVSAWAAKQTGLDEGTPIVAGSGDNMMGAVGAGVVRSGMALVTLGTSGVVFAHADRPCRDLGELGAEGRLHTMCAADGDGHAPGGWCVTGCMLSAAGSLQWARDALFPGSSFEALVAEAEEAPPGCEGLVFLPYLTGERCPHPDPRARGGWIGLTTRHTRGHLIRAVLEGVGFGMGQIMDLMRASGLTPASVRIGGGGARSRLWRGIIADALDLPVASTNAHEGPAFGVALLAGVGVGVWSDVVQACDAAIDVTETIEPDPATQRRLAEVAGVYARLYDDLKERFAELSDAAAAEPDSRE